MSKLSATRRMALAGTVLLSMTSRAGRRRGARTVSGPGADPECFKPWASDTIYLQWPKKEGPYKIALANGFVGNTWRIQMIQTAKAYVEQPEIAPDVEEFKVVSTGTDVAAQIAAIDNFINSGYDAIVTIATNPSAFGAGHPPRQRGRRRARALRQPGRLRQDVSWSTKTRPRWAR